MENIQEAEINLIEIADKNNLPFVIERVNQQTITLNPRIQGVSKQQRDKFKQVSRVCEIVVLSEEKIKKFDSIVVSYTDDKQSLFANCIEKIISTATKRYKKLPRNKVIKGL